MKTASFIALPLLLAAAALAHDGHDEEEVVGAHGGQVAAVGSHRVEVVFSRRGVQVYVDGPSFQPADVRGLGGSIRISDGARVAEGRLRAVDVEPRAYLGCDLDLSRIQEESLVTVTLDPLPGATRKAEVPFRLARQIEWGCPRYCGDPTDAPGACPECQGPLVERFFIYACEQHQGVTSQTPDACWIAQSALRKLPIYATRAPTAPPAHAPAAPHGHDHDHDHDHGHGHGH